MTPPNAVRVWGPGSISNLGPGFDTLGLCVAGVGDVVEVERSDTPGLTVLEGGGVWIPPADPARNTGAVAAASVLSDSGVPFGLSIRIHKGLWPGSGLGSSAASAVAAAWGAALLIYDAPERSEVVAAALAGEAVASGALHGDNVLPALLGGLVLVSATDPTRYRRLPVGGDPIHLAIVRPDIEILTQEARALLPKRSNRMNALAKVVVLTALLCPTVLADQWQTQPAGAANGAPPTSTAPQFKPAPPSPLRAGAAAIRAAEYNDDFDRRAGVKRAQFSNDDFTASPNHDNAGQRRYTPPPRTAQRSAQREALGSGSTGLDLSLDEDNEFAPSQNSQTPRPAITGDNSSFSTGNRTYVPPVDMGPSRPATTVPAATTRNRTNPPPAAVPQRSMPKAVVPRDVLSGSRDVTDRIRLDRDNNFGATTTVYPDPPELTIGRPPATTDTRTTPPPPTAGRYNDGYRQAQVGSAAPVTGEPVIVPPPNYGLSNPLENAANAAANTVERGARGVSSAIKSGADRISEEGRRRGDSYFLTLLALFASVGLNLYLGWIAWDTYNRYQDLVADMRYTGPRRSSTSDTDTSYSATAGIAS